MKVPRDYGWLPWVYEGEVADTTGQYRWILGLIFRERYSLWLALAMRAFGGSIVGLVCLIPRFSNCGPGWLMVLPLDQPIWAWQWLKNFSVNEFIYLRLWEDLEIATVSKKSGQVQANFE